MPRVASCNPRDGEVTGSCQAPDSGTENIGVYLGARGQAISLLAESQVILADQILDLTINRSKVARNLMSIPMTGNGLHRRKTIAVRGMSKAKSPAAIGADQ